MKKIGFYLAHPAHFHLFKHVINDLLSNGCKVLVVYNEKDVLHELIESSEFKDQARRVRANKKVDTKLALLIQFALKNIGAFKEFLLFRPQIVLGTPILVALIGRILPYKSIIVNEDDFDVISKTSELGYPFADIILCPTVCRTSIFESKCIKYNGYHELAYLHPENFRPDRNICESVVDMSKPYFIIRFAKLNAHHDDGIQGIGTELAHKIIDKLEQFGNVYITSEGIIHKELEDYRISIAPELIHHVISHAELYIGDSQTMAAEAGVLGIPFIRVNDFVGKISYLNELEIKYQLGYGIMPEKKEEILNKIDELLELKDRSEEFQRRRNVMLGDKINVAKYISSKVLSILDENN